MTSGVLFFDIVKPEQFELVGKVAERGFLPIVNSPALKNALCAWSLPVRAWQEFEPPDLEARISSELLRLAEGLNQTLQDPAVVQSFASPYGSFLPLTGQAFFEKLLQLLVSGIATIEIFDRLVEQISLRAVVQGCDNNHVQRAIIARARQRAIPTLQLAHALFTPPILGRVAGDMQNLYSDFVAAYGERGHDLMVSTGIPGERIIDTGAPLWDPLYAPQSRIPAGEARQRLGLDPTRPVLTFLCSYSDGSSPTFPLEIRRRLEIHRAIAAAVSQLEPPPQVIMRPHPNELGRHSVSPEDVDAAHQVLLEWLDSLGHRDVRVITDRKTEVIRAADVVLVEAESTALAEAMILERPVVVLSRYEKKSIYSEADGVLYVRDADLAAMLANLLKNRAEREAIVSRQLQALSEINEGNDGHATQRVADLIVELATEGSPGSRRPDGRSEVETWLRRGTALIQSGEFQGARGLFADAHQKFGHHPRILLGLGVALFTLGELEQAFDQLREAHRLDPLDPDVVVSWAAVAEKLGRLSELSDAIAAAHRATPGDEELGALHAALIAR
jgi:Flp pilus assembly protein TadD